MDSLGHINNIIYLQYFEEARIQWMNGLGSPLDTRSTGMILKKSSITYHRPLTHPADVVIETRCGHVGRSSFVLDCTLANTTAPTEVACEAQFVIVWYDYVEATPAAIPDWLRAHLTAGGSTL
jgi:acyl-CoA thioester hydrolase